MGVGMHCIFLLRFLHNLRAGQVEGCCLLLPAAAWEPQIRPHPALITGDSLECSVAQARPEDVLSKQEISESSHDMSSPSHIRSSSRSLPGQINVAMCFSSPSTPSSHSVLPSHTPTPPSVIWAAAVLSSLPSHIAGTGILVWAQPDTGTLLTPPGSRIVRAGQAPSLFWTPPGF